MSCSDRSGHSWLLNSWLTLVEVGLVAIGTALGVSAWSFETCAADAFERSTARESAQQGKEEYESGDFEAAARHLDLAIAYSPSTGVTTSTIRATSYRVVSGLDLGWGRKL